MSAAVNINTSNMYPSEMYGFGATSQVPGVIIDEKIVLKQKEKALKELQSRVQLALAQHEQMYQLQRSHVNAEHDRQLQIAKAQIDDEKANALMTLEQSYSQNMRGIDNASLTQKLSIEQQANMLELHAVQQEMAMKHAERERQWASGGYNQGGSSMIPPVSSMPTSTPVTVSQSTGQQFVTFAGTTQYVNSLQQQQSAKRDNHQ
jgi:hypothetical protein